MSEHINQDIQFIKSMIQKTQQITAGAWMFFLIWGILVILAIFGQFVFVWLGKYQLIWLNWIIFALVGGSITMLYGKRLKRQKGARTFTDQVVGIVSMAAAMGFVLCGFVLPYLGMYSWAAIPGLIAVVAGMLTFILGGVYQWAFLRWSGLFWWAGAVTMNFIPPQYRSLAFIPLILIGYIWPALKLRAMYYQQKSEEAHGQTA